MTAYAAHEAAQEKLRSRQRQEPDEDGFVTVTRGGRTNPAKQEYAQELAAKQKEKQKGLGDFYRFQSREKRKAKAGEMLKKFEADKEKIRKMKERRGRLQVWRAKRYASCLRSINSDWTLSANEPCYVKQIMGYINKRITHEQAKPHWPLKRKFQHAQSTMWRDCSATLRLYTLQTVLGGRLRRQKQE